jgi:hypothetical protein
MNEERRQAARAISNILDAIVKEITNLAGAEEEVHKNRPASLHGSIQGEESIDAQNSLSEVADQISTAAADLRNLSEKNLV